MPSAVGSVSFQSSYAATAPAGLEVQLERYKNQLADWVNCPSCKTPEGKEKIAQITDKIDEIKQRLNAADAAKRTDPPAVELRRDQRSSATVSGDSLGYGLLAAGDSLGAYLNVFA